MAAAGWRNVGKDLAAAAGHEPDQGPGLSADPGEISVTFTTFMDRNIVNVQVRQDGIEVISMVSGRPTGIEVKSQQPAGTGDWVVDRHRARLQRRISRQRASMPGRVSAAAVTGDPNMRSGRD